MNAYFLNYNQKLIGLALVKSFGAEIAKSVFAEVLVCSVKDANITLMDLEKRFLLLPTGILEKRGADFFFIRHSASYMVSMVGDMLLTNLSTTEYFSISGAMHVLNEKSVL